MKISLASALLIIIFSNSFSQQRFQLATPLMQYRSVFFVDTAVLKIEFKQPKTCIHYTLNNSEPAGKGKLYTQPVIIKDRIVTVKARAFGKDFLPSESVQLTFIKNGLAIESVECTAPDEKYAGNGNKTLFDNLGGVPQSSAKSWMGFQNDTVNITVNLKQQKKIREVLLNFLQDEGGWVFLPETINLYAVETTKYNLIGSIHPFTNTATPGSSCVYKIIAPGRSVKTNKLLVQIVTVKNIPEWHQAKGKHAWLFIDELKVY